MITLLSPPPPTPRDQARKGAYKKLLHAVLINMQGFQNVPYIKGSGRITVNKPEPGGHGQGRLVDGLDQNRPDQTTQVRAQYFSRKKESI